GGAAGRAAAGSTAGGWSVVVILTPAPAPAGDGPRLSQCDLDCLALLAQAKEPLSGVRVRKQLDSPAGGRGGRRRGRGGSASRRPRWKAQVKGSILSVRSASVAWYSRSRLARARGSAGASAGGDCGP